MQITLQLAKARGRRVVVNADDFGASHDTNRAVLQAFEKGLISSATIMANMPGFEEACQLARERHLLSRIGLHLNLTEGKPLTGSIAAFPRFCDAGGNWRQRRRVLHLSAEEVRLWEAEIEAQILACRGEGLIPTHLDSHHHMHTQFGLSGPVMRAAQQHGINAVRLAPNCRRVAAAIVGISRRGVCRIRRIRGSQPDSEPMAAGSRMLARASRYAHNMRLRFHGLAKTAYFGDVFEAAAILQMTAADVEVMVHPRLDHGILVDLNGQLLESLVAPLRIPQQEMRSYHELK
jgi:chitin disaccharide deacetylase